MSAEPTKITDVVLELKKALCLCLRGEISKIHYVAIRRALLAEYSNLTEKRNGKNTKNMHN